jgi:succinoglycan biosynthesis protein ExoA
MIIYSGAREDSMAAEKGSAHKEKIGKFQAPVRGWPEPEPPNKPSPPAVSIVVPCFNEERNLSRLLASLAGQDFQGDFEILVVDNASQDGSRTVAADFASQSPRVRVFLESERGTANVRNTGVRNARHDFLAFIDADCEAPRFWLSGLMNSYAEAKLRDPSIVAVGGRNIAPEDSGSFVKAVEIALDSYLGSFKSIQGRQYAEPILVSSLSMANALYERRKISEIGGFDSSLSSEAEDAEINYRLRAAGNHFLFVPESFVWHRLRSSPRLWLKNMFRYGKGRARLLKRYPKMWSVQFVLPLFFLLAMVSIPLAFFWPPFLIPLFYFLLVLGVSLYQAARKKSLRLFGLVGLVYILQHFGYAVGEYYGLLHPRVR